MTERQAQVLEIIEQNPSGIGPTDIGLALGFDYCQASSAVTASIKALMKANLIRREVRPIRYLPNFSR